MSRGVTHVPTICCRESLTCLDVLRKYSCIFQYRQQDANEQMQTRSSLLRHCSEVNVVTYQLVLKYTYM